MINLDSKQNDLDPETLLQDCNTMFYLNLEQKDGSLIDEHFSEHKDEPTSLEKYQYQVEFSEQAFKAGKAS
jgi:hypothetical protein